MNTKAMFTLTLVFCIMYFANWMLPRFIGDDYLYAFVWTGTPMMEPLPEDARRIMSLKDIFTSQWSHYFTWGGRTPAHLLAQFFAWKGKEIFNICSSFVFLLLILEICWMGNGGRVTWKLKSSRILWIFFCLWMFNVSFVGTVVWMVGACNYLWMTVLVLAFLIPYVRFWITEEEIIQSQWMTVLMFPFGILAGWTNENTVCWFILILAIWIYYLKKHGSNVPAWMVAGFSGLVLGYAALILAPGNMARVQYELSVSSGTPWIERTKENFFILFYVLVWQFLLWYPILKELRQSRFLDCENKICRRLFLVKLLCIISLLSDFIMFFTLHFESRTSFSGTVYLIIAHTLLLQGQKETGIRMVTGTTRRFLWSCGTLALIISIAASFSGWKLCHDINDNLMAQVYAEQDNPQGTPVFLPQVPYEMWMKKLAANHLPAFEAPENIGSWENVAFARYYGISGIYGVKKSRE